MEHEVTIFAGVQSEPKLRLECTAPSERTDRLDLAARLADGNAAADLPAQPFHVLGIDVANSFERHPCEQRSLAVHPPLVISFK
jgi:hypothetical protein